MKENAKQNNRYIRYTIDCRKQNYTLIEGERTLATQTDTNTDTESIGRMNFLAKQVKLKCTHKKQKVMKVELYFFFFIQNDRK